MRKKTINFTKSSIAQLPPAEPGKRGCYYDSNLNGLELRVNGTPVPKASPFTGG